MIFAMTPFHLVPTWDWPILIIAMIVAIVLSLLFGNKDKPPLDKSKDL